MRPTCGSGRDERPWRRINSDVLLISILTWMYVFIGEYYGVGWEEKDEELDLGFALCPISRIDNSRILRRAVSEWPGSYSRRRRCTRPDPFVSSFFITAGGPMNASRRDKPREACPFCRLTWDGCFRPHTKVSDMNHSI